MKLKKVTNKKNLKRDAHTSTMSHVRVGVYAGGPKSTHGHVIRNRQQGLEDEFWVNEDPEILMEEVIKPLAFSCVRITHPDQEACE